MSKGDGGFASSVSVTGDRCPACGHDRGEVIYEVHNVPAHQVRLIRSYDAAIHCTSGDIRLAVCHVCGFVWNTAFDPELMDYDEDYESSQAVSPTFNRFHADLADEVVRRYALAGKDVVEIGCGQGEFLAMLRERGVRRAIGFDPVLREVPTTPSVTFIKDWYSEKHADLAPDFVVAKMVMEHVPDPGRFLTMLRLAIGGRETTLAFAMMPEVTRIFRLRAFWDVFYEHCAYFSLGALARAFRAAGFHVVDLWAGYGSQYALITARPGSGPQPPLPGEESAAEMVRLAREFGAAVAELREGWARWLERRVAAGRRVVLWGGGSKGVAFLTTLGIRPAEVPFAVDINEKRAGTYVAGTGQRIVAPAFLADHEPDDVLIMSPIYRNEIAAELAGMRLSPRLLSIEDGPPAEDTYPAPAAATA
jgi:SAM-dependent methyltransferase